MTDSRASLEAFARYRDVRQQALDAPIGVLTPAECGAMLVAIAARPGQFPSGVYLATSPPGGKPVTRYAPFNLLDQCDLMRSWPR